VRAALKGEHPHVRASLGASRGCGHALCVCVHRRAKRVRACSSVCHSAFNALTPLFTSRDACCGVAPQLGVHWVGALGVCTGGVH